MKIIKKIARMQNLSQQWRKPGAIIGFVPTMGALHEGHLSLVKQAKRQCDRVVVSIFVNPKQFGPNEDYARYPRPFNQDMKLCQKAKIDALFAPSVKEMYPEGFQTKIQAGPLARPLCGPFRPGHFDGVNTVVAKLLNAVQPHRTYFGLKDYQQHLIVKKMVQDLNFPVQVIGCPIVREKDGLAKSSRNIYLSKDEREQASRIYRAMAYVAALIRQRHVKSVAALTHTLQLEISKIPHARVDYALLCHPETLEPVPEVHGGPVLIALAVWLGKTRLIDNLLVK